YTAADLPGRFDKTRTRPWIVTVAPTKPVHSVGRPRRFDKTLSTLGNCLNRPPGMCFKIRTEVDDLLLKGPVSANIDHSKSHPEQPGRGKCMSHPWTIRISVAEAKKIVVDRPIGVRRTGPIEVALQSAAAVCEPRGDVENVEILTLRAGDAGVIRDRERDLILPATSIGMGHGRDGFSRWSCPIAEVPLVAHNGDIAAPGAGGVKGAVQPIAHFRRERLEGGNRAHRHPPLGMITASDG